MSLNFLRSFTLTVGTTQIKELRCAFVVEKTNKPAPNKLGLRVWNLTETHRKEFARAAQLAIQLSAGYQNDAGADNEGLIYLGRTRNAQNKFENPGWVTEFGSGDGEQELRTARVAVALAPGATGEQALRELARALGVRPGNLDAAAALVRARKLFPLGTALYGSAAREMTTVCQALNLEWSVQDGALQIVERGEPLKGRAVYLSSRTSDLLGSPEIDAKGVVRVKCQLQPEVAPGRIVVVDSRTFRGQIRAERVIHSGDTHGNEWQTEIEGPRY